MREQNDFEQLTFRSEDLIALFLEITERKVSLDDYGDEDWSALPTEIDICVHKIAIREGDLTPGHSKNQAVSCCLGCGHLFSGGFRKCQRCGGLCAQYTMREAWLVNQKYRPLLKYLEEKFRAFHASEERQSVSDESDIERLTGEEFENRLAGWLLECGYEVLGTPKTGDQGADLIAKRDGIVIAIQAKRYQKPVGNEAVQEVLGAIRFYRADEGWVVTTSSFTPSAKTLAQRSSVKLLHFKELLARLKPRRVV